MDVLEGQRWHGFWRDFGDEQNPRLPKLEDFTDPEWNPSDKDKLIAYIENAPCVLTSGSIGQPCPLCGKAFPVGEFQSDGYWLWPSDLSHYIKNHSVVVPENMAQYIRDADYAPPANINCAIQDLPWPDV